MGFNYSRIIPAEKPITVRVKRIAVPKHLPRHTHYTFGHKEPPVLPFVAAVHRLMTCYVVAHRVHNNALIIKKPSPPQLEG